MNDPKRLSEGSGSDVERALLRAGRAGAPPGAKSRAMAVASGAMAASSLVAAGAAAEGSVAAAKVGSVVVLKWVAVLSVASAGALTGAAVMRTTSEHASSKSVAVSVAPAATARGHDRPSLWGESPRSAPSASTASISTRPVPATDEPSNVPRSVATAAAPAKVRSAPIPGDHGGHASSTLSAELATLDQARAALAAGDAPRSLGILDQYQARFPSGGMAPEAAVLRIEVLLKAGDRTAAQRAADAFLASSPTSPYVPRIQSLLSASNP